MRLDEKRVAGKRRKGEKEKGKSIFSTLKITEKGGKFKEKKRTVNRKTIQATLTKPKKA